MAAYAAALITPKDKFIPMMSDDNPVWGYSHTGAVMYSNLAYSEKLSLIGAMRAAYETFNTDIRTYNSLDKYVRNTASTLYNKNIKDLDAKEAVKVLLTVAKG